MIFDLPRFYRELDAHYDAHDNHATEIFLKHSRNAAWADGAYTPANDGCPSCISAMAVNMGYVCVCNEQGCFYRGLSRWEESLEAFHAALDEMERLYASDDPEYGVILLNLAGVYRYMGDLDQTLSTFEKARVLLEKNKATPPTTLAGLYNNIGLVKLDLHHYQEAADLFTRSLPLLGDPASHPVEYGTTLSNLAVVHQALGQMDAALAAVTEAVRVISVLDGGNNAHYAAVLNSRGILQYRSGHFEEALSDFLLALEKTELIYGRNIEYADACINCAACCKALGRTQDAAAWQHTADAIRAELKA